MTTPYKKLTDKGANVNPPPPMPKAEPFIERDNPMVNGDRTNLVPNRGGDLGWPNPDPQPGPRPMKLR